MLYNVDSDHSVLPYLFYTYKKKKKNLKSAVGGRFVEARCFCFYLATFEDGIACVEPLSYITEKAIEVACTFQFLF